MIPPVLVPLHFEEIFNAFISHSNSTNVFLNLQESIANYNGSKYAFFTTSGRSALYLLLQAYDITPGDEVVMPAYMCSSVSDMLYAMGLHINYVDIDSETYNMNIDDLSEKTSKSTKCILAVHMFGNVCDMKALREIADDNRCILLEDCAQTMGSKYNNRNVGTLGDAGFFSFGRGKPLTCLQGGAIITNDDIIATKCSNLIQQFAVANSTTDFKSLMKMLGYSCIRNRLVYNILYRYIRNERTRENVDFTTIKKHNTTFHGEICLRQLSKLNAFNNARRSNAQTIYSKFKKYKDITMIKELPEAKSFYLRFPIQVDSSIRSRIMVDLLERGIETSVVYPVPLNLLYNTSLICQNVEDICKKTIALPIHPLINKNDINQMVEVLEKYI